VLASSPPTWITRLDKLHLLTPLRIVLIIVVAIVVAIVLRTVVTRLLGRTLHLSGGDRPRAEARQRALSSALRSAVVGVVWGTAVITIISELGVNIGGVIATATVIGGAIAFGAQTLIRDIIAGLFVLAEDQYGVGDTVDLGLAMGEVERITLRSVRLRDSEGLVWHVAHGNVARVLAAVDEVVNRLTERLREDPLAGRALTGDITIVGVADVRDDRLIYRVTADTLPGKRDAVRRAWRRLVLQAFNEGDLKPPPAPPTVAHLLSPGEAAVSTSPGEAPA
jgi:small conductance mechanosensitive channel